ncbi:MAG TPA: 2-isopropylmalate synthase, partial [Treponemataceae bacterium]|nr:2-isopropylmalate synthase [Treponemataceae bacterium]
MTFPGIIGAVSVLDTTLRDGDQSPGCAFSPGEKLSLARILDEVGIDVIEAGFPTSSPVDFRACELIAREGLRARVAAMTRARPEDIEKTARVFASS